MAPELKSRIDRMLNGGPGSGRHREREVFHGPGKYSLGHFDQAENESDADLFKRVAKRGGHDPKDLTFEDHTRDPGPFPHSNRASDRIERMRNGGPGSGRHSVNGITLAEAPGSPGGPGGKSLVGGRTTGDGKNTPIQHEIQIHPDYGPGYSHGGYQTGKYYAEVANPKDGSVQRSGTRIGLESAKQTASEMHKKIYGTVSNGGPGSGRHPGYSALAARAKQLSDAADNAGYNAPSEDAERDDSHAYENVSAALDAHESAHAAHIAAAHDSDGDTARDHEKQAEFHQKEANKYRTQQRRVEDNVDTHEDRGPVWGEFHYRNRADKVVNAWSDASRAAALDARRGHAHSALDDPDYMAKYKVAMDASRKARAEGTSQAHHFAATTHELAAQRAESSGDRANADFHRTMAEGHRFKSKVNNTATFHRSIADAHAADEKLSNLYDGCMSALDAPDADIRRRVCDLKARLENKARATQFAPKKPTEANVEAAPGLKIANGGPEIGPHRAEFSAQMFNRKTRAQTAQENFDASSAKIVNDEGGGAGADAGAGVPASGPAVPANGRLASLSPSPMLRRFAVGSRVGAHMMHEKKKKDLVNALRFEAMKNNGYLPNFKHPTRKEIMLARPGLPDTGKVKNGQRYTVSIGNGISKGKKIEFLANEHYDFKSNRNGKKVREWVAPRAVEDDDFLQ